MDGPSKGGEMEIRTQEVEAAVPELKPIGNPTDEQIDQMMNDLGFDPLTNSAWQNRHDRHEELKRSELRKNFLRASKRGALFVLRGDDDRIIGLLGLRSDIEEGVGRVTLLRTATAEKPQFGITEKLLIAAERYFRQAPRGYTRGIIEASNPSGHLQGAAHHGKLARFWEFSAPEEEETERNPLEQAA